MTVYTITVALDAQGIEDLGADWEVYVIGTYDHYQRRWAQEHLRPLVHMGLMDVAVLPNEDRYGRTQLGNMIRDQIKKANGTAGKAGVR